jgi:hypothetical protein
LKSVSVRFRIVALVAVWTIRPTTTFRDGRAFTVA